MARRLAMDIVQEAHTMPFFLVTPTIQHPALVPLHCIITPRQVSLVTVSTERGHQLPTSLHFHCMRRPRRHRATLGHQVLALARPNAGHINLKS